MLRLGVKDCQEIYDPVMAILDVNDLSAESREILNMNDLTLHYQFRDKTLEARYEEEHQAHLGLCVGAGALMHVVSIAFQRNFLLQPEHAYDFEALGPELGRAYMSLEALLNMYLSSQILLFCALLLVLRLAPLRFTSGCSLGLICARLSWMLVSLYASTLWPVKQWTLVYPPISSCTQFCVMSLTFRHLLYFFPAMLMIWSMSMYGDSCNLAFLMRFAGSVSLVWVFNIWLEDSHRRRWQLRLIFHSEIARMRKLVQDLLPDITPEQPMQAPASLLCKEDAQGRDVSPFASINLPIGTGNVCHCRQAVVLQLDICGFTALAQTLEPLALAHMLHELFGAFDSHVQNLNLFKMDTVGDACEL